MTFIAGSFIVLASLANIIILLCNCSKAPTQGGLMNQSLIRTFSEKKDEPFSDISDVNLIKLIKIDVLNTPYYLSGDDRKEISIVFKAA